jgi:hypothetical protein
VVCDVKVISLEPCRRHLDRKLHETANRAFKRGCGATAAPEPQWRSNEHALDVVELREMRGELLGSEIHTWPAFLQEVGDDCDPSH